MKPVAVYQFPTFKYRKNTPKIAAFLRRHPHPSYRMRGIIENQIKTLKNILGSLMIRMFVRFDGITNAR